MSKLTKTTKTLSDFEGQEPDWEDKLELFNVESNKNKFWHIWTYSSYVVRHWGRHGSKGQTAVHRAYTQWEAKREAKRLYWQKRDKGYIPDNTTVLDRLAREG